MNELRRTLIKGGAAAATLATGLVAGLIRSDQVLAADWNKTAFDAKTMADALKGLGVESSTDSKDILIKAPDVAENGAAVPVEVTCKIAGPQSIAIIVEKNPQPLAASFELSNGTEGYVHVRLKMDQSSNVRVVVNAGGKSFSAVKEVKVIVGGCG